MAVIPDFVIVSNTPNFYYVLVTHTSEKMKLDTIKNINQIIERDSKDTTYKFALLRSVIDSVHEFAHLTTQKDEVVEMPLGLLIYKWLEYYYPIIDSRFFIPQKNGDTEGGRSLAFRSDLKELTSFYSNKGGMSVFFSELRKGKIDAAISSHVFQLCKKIRSTITRNPMKHIGVSVYGRHYSIFQFQSKKVKEPATMDLNFLVDQFGTFTFPEDYFTIFEHLGGFITGKNAILLEWADFTVRCDKSGNLSREMILNEILKSPTNNREVYAAQQFFIRVGKSNPLECVWSGKAIGSNLNIDHVLPFAIWKNNDLWNLLPTLASINNNKRDKIPTRRMLHARKGNIIDYWNMLATNFPELFEKEITISLTGKKYDNKNWLLTAFTALQDKSDYLIQTRGYEPWEY